jgi:hypothetical protein
MGNQVILRRLPTSMSHEVFAKTLSLEDVLVSTVFGALAYGPTPMLQAWRRRFTTLPPLSAKARIEFWPTNHRDQQRQREPDVFVLDEQRREALVIEAKRGRMPKSEELTRQVIEQGVATRASYGDVRLHLLVVTDELDEPLAFATVRSLRPRLYSRRMRHASWASLSAFLREWRSRPETDAGNRSMLDDTLAVMAKYGR